MTEPRQRLGRREFLRAATAAATLGVVTTRQRAFVAETPPLTFSSTTGSTGFETQVIGRLGLEQTYGVKLDVLARQRVPRFFPTEWNEAGVKDVMDIVGEAAKLGQIEQVPSREFVVLLK